MTKERSQGAQYTKTGIPVGSIDVAYRQKTDGELGKSIHYVELTCDGKNCQLETLTLNQCFGDAFFPKTELTRTANGSLKIEAVEQGAIVLRNGVLLMRFYDEHKATRPNPGTENG